MSTATSSTNLKYAKTIFFRALLGFLIVGTSFLILNHHILNTTPNTILPSKKSHILLSSHSRAKGYPGHTIVQSLMKKSASNSDVTSMTNFFNKMYTGTLTIGSPSQTFSNIVFDTGSADLWVISIKSGLSADYLNYYTKEDSNTYSTDTNKNSWSVSYGTGSAVGIPGYETVTISSFTANNQIFAEAIEISDMDISEYEPQDGICGFARYIPNSEYELGIPLMQTLINENINPSGLYAFYLSRHSDSGSKLIIGEDVYDREFYVPSTSTSASVANANDLYWIPVNDDYSNNKLYDVPGLWAIKMNQLLLDDKEFFGSDEEIYAFIDTGTTYIGIPTKYYVRFMEELTKDRSDCFPESEPNSVYFCQDIINPTLNLPTLSLNMIDENGDEIILDLKAEHYIDDSNELGFMPIAIGTDAVLILGDTFLKNYYSVFNQIDGKIGFAPSNYSDSEYSSLLTTILIVSIVVVSLLLILSVVRYFITRKQMQIIRSHHSLLLNNSMNENENEN